MEEKKLRRPEERQELRELWELFRSQERELHEMRIRLSRFMTKGAPVFLQPPKVEAKATSNKPKFHPHVHFSRSLTNGSSGEKNHDEAINERLDDAQSKLHKGRPQFQGQSQQMAQATIKSDKILDNDYGSNMFEEPGGQGLEQNISKDINETISRKKSTKRVSTGKRPKSSRLRKTGRHSKGVKDTGHEEMDDEDELKMDTEDGKGPELKHIASNESEVGEGNDDTSKDFTSLSLATASATGASQQQKNPQISVTNDAQ